MSNQVRKVKTKPGLVSYYYSHRKEVDVLSNDFCIFLLGFVLNTGEVTLQELKNDIDVPQEKLGTCLNLLEDAGFVRTGNGRLRVTQEGQQFLAVYDLLPKAKPSVLVIDDIEDWRSHIHGILERENKFRILEAGDLKQANIILNKEEVAVAIIDLRLKDWEVGNTEGFDIIKHIISNKLATRTIILTAYGDVEIAREAFRKFNVYDMLTKQHFDSRQLVRTVAAAARGRDE